MTIEHWKDILKKEIHLFQHQDWQEFSDWCEENSHPYLCVAKLKLEGFILYIENYSDSALSIRFEKFYLNDFILKILNRNRINYIDYNFCYKGEFHIKIYLENILFFFDDMVKVIRLFNSIHFAVK